MDWITTNTWDFIKSLPDDTPVEFRLNVDLRGGNPEKVHRGVVFTKGPAGKYVGSRTGSGWNSSVTHIRVVPSSPEPVFPRLDVWYGEEDVLKVINALPVDARVKVMTNKGLLPGRIQVFRGRKHVEVPSQGFFREAINEILVPSTQPASAEPSDESPAEALSSGVPSMTRLVTTIVTFTPPATKENPSPQTQILREPVTEVATGPADSSISTRIAVKEVPGLAAKHKIPDDQLNLIRIEYLSQTFNEVRITS